MLQVLLACFITSTVSSCDHYSSGPYSVVLLTNSVSSEFSSLALTLTAVWYPGTEWVVEINIKKKKNITTLFSNLFVRQVMIQILKDMGITEYEPRVINQMLEFTYSAFPAVFSSLRWSASTLFDSPSLTSGYVTTIIEDAKIYATHAKKSTVDADDIKLAIQCRMDQSFTSPPPRDVCHRHHLSFTQWQIDLAICVRAHNVELHVLCFSFCWRWPDKRTRPPCR